MAAQSASAFVLDASVTAAWLLPDEHSPAARHAYSKLRAATVQAHAPELWLWECGNIIANAHKHKRLSADDALLTWSVLDAVRTRVELASFEPAQTRACLALALDQSLSIYDASYLWLALSHKLPLLTHDDKLAAAAKNCGLGVLRLEHIH
jgi:predicted nucleic acid-binding protein